MGVGAGEELARGVGDFFAVESVGAKVGKLFGKNAIELECFLGSDGEAWGKAAKEITGKSGRESGESEARKKKKRKEFHERARILAEADEGMALASRWATNGLAKSS